MNLHWFSRTKIEPVVKSRPEFDSIRRVFREEEKIIKKSIHPIYRGLAIIIGLVILANLGFFGTVAADTIKDKTVALKMFEKGNYLVLLQNNTEMRPTGGFIGTFAIVSFSNYKISKIDFNTNIYKLDNAFTKVTQVVPPAPLAKISDNHWAMRDANFAVDFPTASQDVQWFLEKESGQKVDGVIAVNASLVQDLLSLTGPINLDKYDMTVTSSNFLTEMAQKIEKEYFYDTANQVENEPKTILKDLMPILMEKTVHLPKYKLVKLALDSLSQKMVLLESNSAVTQQSILLNNWGGEVQATTSDYLAINNANITDLRKIKNGGAKTSLNIKESINYTINEVNGALESDLTLTRSHIGSYTWPDGVNMNWTKILVPAGSVLVNAQLNGQDVTSKIETGQEAGKTYFATWINTAPQTSNVLNLKYELPISTSNYSLLVQKQPGNLGDNLTVNFKNRTIYNDFFNQDLKLKAR